MRGPRLGQDLRILQEQAPEAHEGAIGGALAGARGVKKRIELLTLLRSVPDWAERASGLAGPSAQAVTGRLLDNQDFLLFHIAIDFKFIRA